MATSDIDKLSVYDARIVQNPAKFAVEKGGLSLTNAPFNAIGASASQLTFNINAPSQNVFLDRAVDWSADVFMGMTVTMTADAGAAPTVLANTTAVVAFGIDCALCALPLNSLVSTLTATINDTSVVINSESVLKEVLRLSTYAKVRRLRTAPTKLDMYQSYNDAYLAVNQAIAGFADAVSEDYVPNGAWYDIQFVNPLNGAAIATTGTVAAPIVIDGVNYINGVPVRTPGAVLPALDGPYNLAFKFRTTEKLVLSPFVFADNCEYDTGLFGLNNIQLVMNMKSGSGVSRVIRSTTRRGRVISNVAFLASVATPIANSKVNCIFITPSLDIPLPAKSIIPYMEFPRYISTFQLGGTSPAIATGSTFDLQSQTIVLPNIPDLLLIYAKPKVYAQTEGDWYYPISKISLNFDNFSGLLASHTAEQLFHISQHNGVEMSWLEWSGRAKKPSAALIGDAVVSGNIASVGGILALKPGSDFALQSGQAPSLIGNFTLQFNLTCINTAAAAVGDVELYVITVNSGFFETLAGSSRIIKGVLSEADIISAPAADVMTADGMKRMVGAGFFDRLGSFMTKARDIYQKTKPAVSAFKEALPEGKVKGALGAVGYGQSGGAMKKGLAARLM
jgi:hypothetical protein